MITLEYECKKIRSPKEMEEIEKYVEEWRERSENFRESLSATYNALVRVLHPGKPEDGCMIVTLEVIAPDLALSEKDGNTFADLAMEALIATGLNKQYVLSVRMKENASETRCLIAFFPMEEKKRVPNADNWLYGRDKSKPATNLQDDIEIKIAGQFKNVTVTREDSVVDETHGYKPALLNYKPIPYQKEFDTEIIYPTLDVDAHVQTQLPYDVIARYSDEILRTFTTGTERLYYERSQKPGTEITETMFMRKVEDFLHNKYPDIGPMDTRTILNRIRRAIYGNYILEPLIESEEISDIACMAPDRIRVKVGGKHYTSNLKFLDVADYYRFIQSICIRNNLKAYNGGSEADNCINVFTDSISSKRFILRCNLTLPYVTNSYPQLQIRKISRDKRDLTWLVNTAHMLDDNIANYLKSHVQAGDGLMVAGLPAAGKSTLLNAMVDVIPYSQSVAVIQESREIFSNVHPQMYCFSIKPGSGLSLEKLAVNALLIDAQVFVIGETKEPGQARSIFDFVTSSGNQPMTTIHANSALEAIPKMAALILRTSSYSLAEVEKMLTAFKIVVYVQDYKVQQIVEIHGFDEEKQQLIMEVAYERPKQRY